MSQNDSLNELVESGLALPFTPAVRTQTRTHTGVTGTTCGEAQIKATKGHTNKKKT